MAPKLKLVMLDVLKPHKPTITELSREISKLNESYSVTVETQERDAETETVRIIIEGESISMKEVRKVISSLGGTIQSIDKVCFK